VSSRGFLLPLLYLFWIVDALTMANARIVALEDELNASREAWEGANAAKVAAEKATKSAETKAKKAEKALADADQKRVQREQAIAERLDKISVLVGSKCRVVLFCLLAHTSIY
jgi:chromosome segregation ATPase